MSIRALAGFAEGFGQSKQKKNDRADYERWMNLQEAGLNSLGAASPGMGTAPLAAGVAPPGDFQQGGDRDAFIAAMMPHAMRVAEQTGLDPRLIIAQAAQETGWGRSAPGNNYFGVKSHGAAGGNTMATNEVINGKTVRVNDSFRGYGSMGESADGYGEFLRTNPRYKSMLAAGNLDGQLAALGKSGYATDPNYAASVGSIARGITLPTPQQPAPILPVSTEPLGALRLPLRSAAQ